MESDMTKYKTSNLCQILSNQHVKSVVGVGLLAFVAPLDLMNEDILDPSDPERAQNVEENLCPVVIVNRPGRWFESDLADKYYVLTLNTIEDRKFGSVGLLVPKSTFTFLQDFKNPSFVEADTGEMVPLIAQTKDFISIDR